jgi:5-methylcytosine-specific restriction endonuclease McrA
MAHTHGRKGRPWVRIQRQVVAWAVAQGIPCAKCGLPIDPPGIWPHRHPKSPSVDHKVPLSKAPSRAHDPDNLRAMHYGCNSSRGDATHEHVRRAW